VDALGFLLLRGGRNPAVLLFCPVPPKDSAPGWKNKGVGLPPKELPPPGPVGLARELPGRQDLVQLENLLVFGL